MRVIAGEKRGKILCSISGKEIRPTSDKVKGAIFSTLQHEVKDGKIFIDLFGGSGAMGIEALSRGMEKAYFFDVAKESIEIINKNLKLTQYEDKGRALKISAMEGINYLYEKKVKCDLIFMDPPYIKAEECVGLLELISQKEILSENGKIVIECEKSVIMPLEKNNLQCYKTKKYGITTINYYSREIN